MKKTLLVSLIFCCQLLQAQTLITHSDYFPRVNYNAKTVDSRTDEAGTSFEKIALDGFDSRVPFYHIKPKNSNNQHVILLHGLTGSKDNWIYPMTSLSEKYVKLKDSLVKLGFNVIIPDAKYHGERSYEIDFASPISLYSSQDVQKVYNMLFTTIKDIQIIMDYVEANSEEPTIFNAIGYSMGGIVTVHLNGIDKRLNRVVACVAPINVRKVCMRLGMSEEYAKKLDFASLTNYSSRQKAPLTLLMGKEDGWYTQEEAQEFFDTVTITDKSLKFYDAGHYLPESFIPDTLNGIVDK